MFQAVITPLLEPFSGMDSQRDSTWVLLITTSKNNLEGGPESQYKQRLLSLQGMELVKIIHLP